MTGPVVIKLLLLPTLAFVQTDPALVVAVDQALAEAATSRPELTPLAADALKEAVRGSKTYTDRIALARELAEEGVRAYERMHLEDAVSRLTKSSTLLDRTQHRWIDSAEVAEVRLTLALAHLESGRRDKAHLALKALLRLDPHRTLAKGYYSPGAIQAFQVARADFDSAADHSLGPALAAAPAKLVGARYVMEAHLRRRARGAAALVVSLYDAKTKRLIDRESVAADPETLAWRAERLVSRMLACLTPDGLPDAPPNPYPGGRWRIGASVASEVYGRRPAREPFVSVGLDVRGDFLVRPHLMALGRLGFATSTRAHLSSEDYEDLRGSLDTSRLLLAIGPRFGGERLEAHVAAGVEAMAPSAVRHTEDPGCKFGAGQFCLSQRHDPGLLFGPGLVSGLSWRIIGPIRLHAEAGMTWYVLSAGDNALNAPIRLGLGLAYAF